MSAIDKEKLKQAVELAEQLLRSKRHCDAYNRARNGLHLLLPDNYYSNHNDRFYTSLQRKLPITRQRIIDALKRFGGTRRELHYPELAEYVYPAIVFPRAHRGSTNGGPPGCYMTLSSLIRRMPEAYVYWDSNQRKIVRLKDTGLDTDTDTDTGTKK